MIFYIFEDSADSQLSRFIERGMLDNCKAVFASSNVLLQSKLDAIYNATDKFVVFVDVVDCKETQDIYFDLQYNTRNQSNVQIVQIPCIEYFLLKLYGFKEIPVQIALQFGDYKSVDFTKYGLVTSPKSFEKYCKHLCNHFIDSCKRGYDHQKGGKSSRFYNTDCICNIKMYGCTATSCSVIEKASNFVNSLLSSIGAYDYTMLHSLSSGETKSMNMF